MALRDKYLVEATQKGKKTMVNDNYTELNEAIYLFNRIHAITEPEAPQQFTKEIELLGINKSTHNAILRILVANNLMSYDKGHFIQTEENKENMDQIYDNIIKIDQTKQYPLFYQKATDESHFFFDNITDLEYDIYSRCDFDITYTIGRELTKHVHLEKKSVLELGGNSGGLGTALIQYHTDCDYTIVDMKIPCSVGKALNKSCEQNITFVEGDVFALKLEEGQYDYIISMNLLHDFDDAKCLAILDNCSAYANKKTKYIVVEDILSNEFEPKEVVMHGLRLSVECRGGKQRTIEEFEKLFLNINYKLEKTVMLNQMHTMLIMESK